MYVCVHVEGRAVFPVALHLTSWAKPGAHQFNRTSQEALGSLILSIPGSVALDRGSEEPESGLISMASALPPEPFPSSLHFILNICLIIYVCSHIFLGVQVGCQRKLVGVGSFLPQCGSWGEGTYTVRLGDPQTPESSPISASVSPPHGSTRITDVCPAMASFLHGHSCPHACLWVLYMLGHLPGSSLQSREVVFIVLWVGVCVCVFWS